MNDTLLTSTMRISDETKRELVKIGAQLSIKDGTERSMEDVVKYLIDTYKKNKKWFFLTKLNIYKRLQKIKVRIKIIRDSKTGLMDLMVYYEIPEGKRKGSEKKVWDPY